MLWLLLLCAALAFAAYRAYRRPHGVYLKSVLGVVGVIVGWALFWFALSPANEAGLGFFAIWVVLAALALAIGLAASLGATARHLVSGLRRT
jgi:hypothetical protein